MSFPSPIPLKHLRIGAVRPILTLKVLFRVFKHLSVKGCTPRYTLKIEALRGVMSDRIGELLVRENLISLSQLKDAQAAQRTSRESLTYTLAKLGMVGESSLTEFLSRHYGIPPVNLEEEEIDEE